MRAGTRLRSRSDGQLAVLVEAESGDLMVALDRPAERRQVPYRAHEWEPAPEERLTPLQVARVAYEADTALRGVRGEYSLKSWLGLKDEERARLIQGMPGSPDALRRRLYEAIKGVLAG